MGYGYFKDLTRITASNKILRDKAFNIAKNQKYDGYQRDLASMVYKFFHKKTSGETVKNKKFFIKELADKLHKPIIKKIQKKKSTITFYRQYLGRRPSRYAMDRQI